MPYDTKQIASAAAQGFQLLQCEECADQVQAALLAAGHSGERIELRAAHGHLFMICKSYDGGKTSITQNGRHVAIRVGDTVFDNLHAAGVPFDEWLRDFEAFAGVSIVHVDPF